MSKRRKIDGGEADDCGGGRRRIEDEDDDDEDRWSRGLYDEFRRRVRSILKDGEDERELATTARAMVVSLKRSGILRNELAHWTARIASGERAADWCSTERMRTYESLVFADNDSPPSLLSRLRFDNPVDLSLDIRRATKTAASSSSSLRRRRTNDDRAMLNSNDYGESLLLRLLALEERISEVSGDDDGGGDDLFAELRTSAVCEYSVADCLAKYVLLKCVALRRREEEHAAASLAKKREAELLGLREISHDTTRRTSLLERALTEESARIAKLNERESALRAAMIVLERRIVLSEDRVNQQAMLVAKSAIDEMRRDLEEVERRRDAELAEKRAALERTRAEENDAVAAVCRLLKRLRNGAADERLVSCDYNTVVLNAEYLSDTADKCENSSTLISVTTRVPREILAIVENCDALRRVVTSNHALRRAIDELTEEEAKQELFAKTLDVRTKSIAAYGNAMHRYGKWRDCLLDTTRRAVLLSRRFALRPYETPTSAFFKTKTLVDLTTSESERFERSVLHAQERSMLTGMVDPCRVWIYLLHGVMSLEEVEGADAAAEKCRMALPTLNDMYELLNFENEIGGDSSGRRRSDGGGAVANTMISWPKSRRPQYEDLGLRFAVLCACSPVPASQPTYLLTLQ